MNRKGDERRGRGETRERRKEAGMGAGRRERGVRKAGTLPG